MDSIGSSSSFVQTTIHFFFIAQIVIPKDTLSEKIATIDVNLLTENEDNIVNILLFVKLNSKNFLNKLMLNGSIEFILSTERFNN